MEVIAAKFSQLRDLLECAAFLVGKGGNEKQVHSQLVRALVMLAETERICLVGGLETSTSDKYADEVSKVRSRLRLWARPDRQGQINARILNAFLRLEKSGVLLVSERDLRHELADVESFDSNFAQMKVIADKNHGKIFEQEGSSVRIWEPVLPFVREYESATNLVSLIDKHVDSHTILAVRIVNGNELKSNWRVQMQVITTDAGEFIDNLPGKLFGFVADARPGFDWTSKLGQTVDGIRVFAYAGYKWLNKQ